MCVYDVCVCAAFLQDHIKYTYLQVLLQKLLIYLYLHPYNCISEYIIFLYI